MVHTHQFIYNGQSSRDLGLVLSGEDTWVTPTPELEHISVPGRSGDLLLSNRRYSNVELTYRVGIPRFFAPTYSALMNFLLVDAGYHRLEDSYHPEVFRLAVMESEVSPHMGARNHSGTFDLTFSCKPQQYLKSGERTTVFTANGSLFNPTRFDAKPLLRVYGTGQLGIGEETITIAANPDYIDLDCETEDAFCGATNMNAEITLSSGDFPVLRPNSSGIVLGSGITRLEITPRWWRL